MIAWKHEIGATAATAFTADLDGDGRLESYSAENWRIVRRDERQEIVWKSKPISRAFSIVAFEDLDGDGHREPLMEGSGLNSASPLYFVFDPLDGRIRWEQELPASNGGDVLIGKLDPSRKGLQCARALFPNPGQGELHLFCWEKGIEEGYRLWSWSRPDDHVYFPQLVLGDFNGDGNNEILMLSHMCIRAFDVRSGNEIGRIAWGTRGRSYGGYFGVRPMRPDGSRSMLVASAFNRVTVIDPHSPHATLRWDHAFEPGVGDSDLQGQLQFVPDGVCDLDGDGWAEVVVNQCDAHREWSTIVLGAHHGDVLSELRGVVIVGAADLDGDAKSEVFLRRRIHQRDSASGPISVARWMSSGQLQVVWTAPWDGEVIREPNLTEARLDQHPVAGDRVKLAQSPRAGQSFFFLRGTGGKVRAFEPDGDGFRQVERAVHPDLAVPIVGTAVPGRYRQAPLAADLDQDGRNEVIQQTAEETWTILKPPQARNNPAEVLGRIEGLRAPPLFADLDGDGSLEILAVRPALAEDSAKHLQACLEATRLDGRLLWRKAWKADSPYKHTLSLGGAFAIPFIGVGHFTRSDAHDVVVSYAGEQTEGHTAVLDGRTGATVWDLQKLYPNMYGSCWDLHPPLVFDYDQDGLDDLATICQTVHYTVLRGTDGQQLLAKPRSLTGQAIEGGAPLFPDGWAVGAMLGGARSAGNSMPEVAVFSSQGPIGVFHPSGDSKWFLNLTVVDQVPSPGCWADVDGDGQPEVAYLFKDGRVGIYDARTGTLRWEQPLESLGSLVAADVDGDGCDEVLFSSEKGFLYCLSEKLVPNARSHVRWSLEFNGIPGPAIFTEVTPNAGGEILVPVSDGFLYSLKASEE